MFVKDSRRIKALQEKGLPIAFVGDVVGTGSSRKSGTNSVLWYFGDDMPGVPNKRSGGVCIGGKVAPIFFNTMEDSGALVFEAPVEKLAMGDVKNLQVGDVVEAHASGRSPRKQLLFRRDAACRRPIRYVEAGRTENYLPPEDPYKRGLV